MDDKPPKPQGPIFFFDNAPKKQDQAKARDKSPEKTTERPPAPTSDDSDDQPRSSRPDRTLVETWTPGSILDARVYPARLHTEDKGTNFPNIPSIELTSMDSFIDFVEEGATGPIQVLWFEEQDCFVVQRGGLLFCVGAQKFKNPADYLRARDLGFEFGPRFRGETPSPNAQAGLVFVDLSGMLPKSPTDEQKQQPDWTVDGNAYYLFLRVGLENFSELEKYMNGRFHAHHRESTGDDRQNLKRVIDYAEMGKEYFHKAIWLGFTDRWDFEDAMDLGLKNAKEWAAYLKGEFHRGREPEDITNPEYREKDEFPRDKEYDAEEYCRALELGFHDVHSYEEATIYLGVTDRAEQVSFERGDYKDADEFRAAKRGGFTNPAEFREAKALGIKTLATFQAFKQSGCETLEEFDQGPRVPLFLNKCRQAADKAWRDATVLYDGGNGTSFLVRAYEALENAVDLVYAAVTRETTFPDDLQMKEKLDLILAERPDAQFPPMKDLAHYREMRDEVEAGKLELTSTKELEGAKFFFHELISNLKFLDRALNAGG